jgi:hypothetical protein
MLGSGAGGSTSLCLLRDRPRVKCNCVTTHLVEFLYTKDLNFLKSCACFLVRFRDSASGFCVNTIFLSLVGGCEGGVKFRLGASGFCDNSF